MTSTNLTLTWDVFKSKLTYLVTQTHPYLTLTWDVFKLSNISVTGGNGNYLTLTWDVFKCYLSNWNTSISHPFNINMRCI